MIILKDSRGSRFFRLVHLNDLDEFVDRGWIDSGTRDKTEVGIVCLVEWSGKRKAAH